MEDAVVIGVLVGLIGAILRYLYRVKKRGETCIGCPHAKKCQGNCKKKNDRE